jgi:hypothetical protein
LDLVTLVADPAASPQKRTDALAALLIAGHKDTIDSLRHKIVDAIEALQFIAAAARVSPQLYESTRGYHDGTSEVSTSTSAFFFQVASSTGMKMIFPTLALAPVFNYASLSHTDLDAVPELRPAVWTTLWQSKFEAKEEDVGYNLAVSLDTKLGQTISSVHDYSDSVLFEHLSLALVDGIGYATKDEDTVSCFSPPLLPLPAFERSNIPALIIDSYAYTLHLSNEFARAALVVNINSLVQKHDSRFEFCALIVSLSCTEPGNQRVCLIGSLFHSQAEAGESLDPQSKYAKIVTSIAALKDVALQSHALCLHSRC